MTGEQMAARVALAAASIATDAGRLIVESSKASTGDSHCLVGVMASIRDELRRADETIKAWRSTQ